MGAKRGGSGAYWKKYTYIMNRVNRALHYSVTTNNVDSYVETTQSILDAFFSLTKPNCPRWGSLFLYKLYSLDSKAKDMTKAGVFSIRKTKNYSKSAVDLS